jgi:hypothetical protein
MALTDIRIRNAKPSGKAFRLTDVSQTIENDLIPELGKMPIRAIQAAHLLAALRKIEARGAPTVAARARFLSSEIWRHATCTFDADVVPASE